MTRWLIRRVKSKTTWNLVTFTEPNGHESAGIVDLLAIRKDHKQGVHGLKRGDVFEVILIQVKGGGAKWPTREDISRLEKVGQIYRAKAVLLAEWKKGGQPVFYRLKRSARNQPDAKAAWERMDRPSEMFG
jgi:hypothetical protein